MSSTFTVRTYPQPAYEPIQNFRIDTRVNQTFEPISIETAYKDFGEIELIIIQYNNSDQKHLKYINDIINLYADCLMLVKDSVITVFTRKTKCQEEIEKKSDHIPYDGYSKDKTFGVYSNLDGVKCVLLEDTHFSLLSKLDRVRKQFTSIVAINIEDFKRKCTERKIQSVVTEVLQSENTPPCRTHTISLSRLREVNRGANDKVVLQRESYESYQIPGKLLPKAVAPREVFHTYPVLEISFSRPGQYEDAGNLPTLNEVSPTVAIQNYTISAQVNGPSQVQYSKYREYEDRKNTFSKWDTRKPEPEGLSKAGFFYTGKEDLVRCFTCGLGLKDFIKDIVPIDEHVRHSDQCPFLAELLSKPNLEALKKELRARDPEYNRRAQHRESPRKFKHPDYETVEARISSFAKWPLKYSHCLVAESGLYYTGFEAVVRCFACDGGFRRLKSTDDLWLDHCFYFPSCSYMQMKLGMRFIQLVQETVDDIEKEEAKESQAVSRSTLQRQSGEIHPENRHGQRTQCFKTVFQVSDIEIALKNLTSKGLGHDVGPVLDLLEEVKTDSPLREKLVTKLTGYRQEQNETLGHMVYCKTCEQTANALFLPCAHLKYCFTCAEQYKKCPICGKDIQTKEKTYR